MSNTIQSKALATTPLSTNDIIAIVQSGVLKRTTVGDLQNIVDATITSNANGFAVRFDSGLQICFRNWSTTRDITTAASGGFRSTSLGVSWTASFVDTDYRIIALSSGIDALAMQGEVLTASQGSILWWRADSASSVAVEADVIAIGQWK